MGRHKSLIGFISYSHKDRADKDKLLEHLESIRKSFHIDFWHDGQIDIGDNIDEEVFEKLKVSDIIILLISSSYIASNFCYNIELKHAVERKTCIIIPVMLKNTALNDNMPFYKIKSLPYDRKPISSYKPKDNGFVNVAEAISKLLEKKFPTSNYKSKPIKAQSINKDESTLYVNLYQDGELSPYPLNQDLVTSMKLCYDNLILLNNVLYLQLKEHIKVYKTLKQKNITNRTKGKSLKVFLLDICYAIRTWIFRNTGVRIQIRVLQNDKYVCILDTDGANSESRAKDMYIYESMIYHSGKHKFPFLKSLNKKYHQEGNNDKIWADYITITFNNIDKMNPLPLLSMCISVDKEHNKQYYNTLIALSCFRIDLIIENYIINYIENCVEIDTKYSLKNIIESY